jgi:hypothetical protein
MILETAIQRDDDWYAARCGKATASRFRDAMATLKNGQPAQAAKDYLTELVVERLTGRPDPEVHDCRHALGHRAGSLSACRLRAEHGH